MNLLRDDRFAKHHTVPSEAVECDHSGRMIRLRTVAIYPPVDNLDLTRAGYESAWTWVYGTTLNIFVEKIC